MTEDYYNISTSRNIYRKRRNVIRRLFLFLFIIIVILSTLKTYKISKYVLPKIEIENNMLISPEFLTNIVLENISGQQFIFISPRVLSEKLSEIANMSKKIVVRKYIFPELKIKVIVKEKNLWAAVTERTVSGANWLYISDEGDLVSATSLIASKLPKNMFPIYASNINKISKQAFYLLKDIHATIVNKNHIPIKCFKISELLDLEMITDSGLTIKAGKIDSDIQKRISKYFEVSRLIGEKTYLVEYVDLTLDNAVVLKKQTLKQQDPSDLEGKNGEKNKSKNKNLHEGKSVKRKKQSQSN